MAAATAVGRLLIPGLGGINVPPPAGYVFLVDSDGAILTDPDGAYLVELA